MTPTAPWHPRTPAPPTLPGHDAVTGAQVHYVARAAVRLCNGRITGGAGVGKTTVAERIADALGRQRSVRCGTRRSSAVRPR